MSRPITTRFAPSPTGALHLGNARTALFNWLLARKLGGRFLLRIEDTDRARSEEAEVAALMGELQWLGLDWDAGPDRDDGKGPYRQSARTPVYEAAWQRLIDRDLGYPCYCTPLELELARKQALSAGRAPRYAGTCADLDTAARAARLAEGRGASLRFRVSPGQVIEYLDLVRGPQRFLADELGDFIVRRADGGAAFLFCNVIDDAAMGVTHVLRGEDHVANTPRQLLIARALELDAPAYGHVPLLVGSDGAPLSKRHGSASVRDIRTEGYLPQAVVNLLARLGHSYADEGWHERPELVAHFDLGSLGRAPAHFDVVQLNHWQKEAVHRGPPAALEAWARGRVPPGQEARFIAGLRANLVLPGDAATWAPIVYGELPCAQGEVREAITFAGAVYFSAALAASAAGADYASLIAALKKATGLAGRALFRPLRAALTQRFDGPELAQLLGLMPPAVIAARFTAARELASRPLPIDEIPNR